MDKTKIKFKGTMRKFVENVTDGILNTQEVISRIHIKKDIGMGIMKDFSVTICGSYEMNQITALITTNTNEGANFRRFEYSKYGISEAIYHAEKVIHNEIEKEFNQRASITKQYISEIIENGF